MSQQIQRILVVAGAIWLFLLVLSALDFAFLNVLAGTSKVLFQIVAVITGVLVYFIPSFVAIARQHPSTTAIFALNLFLGWSFIGWVVALVWSLTG